MADIACWMSSVTNVPVYDTLGEESVCLIFEQTELSTVFASFSGIAKLVALKKKGKAISLKHLVCFDPFDAKAVEQVKEVQMDLIPFEAVLKRGKEDDVKLKTCEPDTLMTINYTSGTTGRSKGVLTSHGNAHASATSWLYTGCIQGSHPGWTVISYMPLAHIFERVMSGVAICGVWKVGFYHGDTFKLADDILALSPEFFVGVPRMFCRFYDSAMGMISALPAGERKMIRKAIDLKMAAFKATGSIKNWFYDNFFLKKVRAIMGGRMEFSMTGGAPIDQGVVDYFRILFSVPLIQAYGQTEATASMSCSYPDDLTPNSVGPPEHAVEFKVVDVPEMNYRATDMTDGRPTPRGELCVKGPTVSRGYFKDPERTREAIDPDGWLHLGDIGEITENGLIKVIDRKKSIFKMQQGEYVAPEKLENALSNTKWVNQIFIHGDSIQSYVLGIVNPKRDVVLQWAKEQSTSLLLTCRYSRDL